MFSDDALISPLQASKRKSEAKIEKQIEGRKARNEY